MELVTGLKFTGKWFTGKIEVLSVDEDKNELKVYLNDSWEETWNLEHTRIGFSRGDYFLSQRQIKTRNLEVAYHTRHYRSSPFKSLGQILSFIYVYCGFNVMESCSVGQNQVTLHSNRIATFEFDEEKQIPIFKFLNTLHNASEAEENQEILINEILENGKV
ncbi:MAG: hypothetical protein PQJ49_06205 [Sphaerochaetaceae bacterium]|nr:hypothetical protein [Sphaerochaetaceae bacterium]